MTSVHLVSHAKNNNFSLNICFRTDYQRLKLGNQGKVMPE